jgi:hypothetical protein
MFVFSGERSSRKAAEKATEKEIAQPQNWPVFQMAALRTTTWKRSFSRMRRADCNEKYNLQILHYL